MKASIPVHQHRISSLEMQVDSKIKWIHSVSPFCYLIGLSLLSVALGETLSSYQKRSLVRVQLRPLELLDMPIERFFASICFEHRRKFAYFRWWTTRGNHQSTKRHLFRFGSKSTHIDLSFNQQVLIDNFSYDKVILSIMSISLSYLTTSAKKENNDTLEVSILLANVY